MNQMQTATSKRIGIYENVFSSIKVNRFVCKSWGLQIAISSEEINDMIIQAYY